MFLALDGAFSFPPNGFISHLIVLSTLHVSCSYFPCGAGLVFSFSRIDSLSEDEKWGVLKSSLK